ncbi:beta-lactamase family protein [Streptomyces sp. NBC_01186]|uniref:serine hydrolase domain-containing protein n=1 Tax=Streptomyces sp. NBC_01186 TaxID=2903765 RepID=UPI002E0D7642|nr:beta-lactamase family protein [Streptomyces sp. NBC_01186]
MTTSEVQRVLDRAVSEGGVPGIVAEIRDGAERWFGTAGTADTATGAPRTAAERFRVGSVTKTFVATVALRLADEGRLSLDDTVEQWLPGLLHEGGGSATLRQLLGHTSGIFNYTQDQEALNRRETHTPEQLVGVAAAHPPVFAPPGTHWGYSNTNYVLAGLIIERATGGALADEITGRVAGPLGLTGTYLPNGDDPEIRGPHARHYTKLFVPGPEAPVHDATELDSSLFWAAGGMISTLGDLSAFFRALLDGQVLPADSGREMFTTTPTRDWIPNTAYGLGISSLTLPSGRRLWGMGGALFGSWTYVYGSRDGTRSVALNVNSDWTEGCWEDPIGIFDDVLHAAFRPAAHMP